MVVNVRSEPAHATRCASPPVVGFTTARFGGMVCEIRVLAGRIRRIECW